MYTLGINAAFHDTAACLVRDGVVVAAAEDERFTHVKHGKRPVPFSTYELPYHAIDYCLGEANIRLADVDHVAYSFAPSLLFNGAPNAAVSLPMNPGAEPLPDGRSQWEPLFLCSIMNAPGHLADGVPHHLEKRFRDVRPDGPYQWHFVEHHVAHAASAFLASPFEHAALMTLDGRGELATTTYGRGDGSAIDLFQQVNMPDSLGLLYERLTAHLGFLHSSDEYKVMALASFGKPSYLKAFHEIIHVENDGGYHIDSRNLAERFGPPRHRGEPLEQRHFDIASSLQVALEQTVLELSHWLHRATGEHCLAMAGGVALNCVMNARIRDHGPFKHVWVQPAAGDAGTALGAAMWVDARQRAGSPRQYQMDHAFLGPAYSDADIEEFLRWSKLPYRKLDDVVGRAADLLVQNKVLGWFQSRMEFGPRALGARSILASPIDPAMQARLNDIKDREDFRPVAPVVLEEDADEWFVDARPSPFMLFVFDVRPEKAPLIPAVSHVDGTARIQTINRRQNPMYYDLIRAFKQRTGVPVLVNTSFNTRGEPIVCTPRDAIESYLTSPLDSLVIGSFLLEKRP
ncbi:MAG: nodulation protein [Planctomycetaceae bacterium]|nr:nodulation protein [Planctomycetaceae bacterium]